MKKNYTALTTQQLIQGLPKLESLTLEEQYNPNTVAVAYVSGNNTLDRYKYHWEHRMKLANLLSVGGTVLLVLPHSMLKPTLVRLQDEELILQYQLEQLMYLRGKYTTITNAFYAMLGKTLFKGWNRGELNLFIENVLPILAEDKPAWKTDLLDGEYASALAFYEDERQAQLEQWTEQQRVNQLWNEAVQLRLFRSQEAMIKTLPNQEVTALQLPVTREVKRYRYDSITKTYTNEVYWKKVTNYEKTTSTELEATIVNAWFYGTPEFRIPTLDEQVKELEALREWFEQYKYHARRNNVRTPQAKTVEKFSRLEWLEIEVGAYLQGDQGLATLGNPPKTSDHESRSFKLNRLAQLLRRRNELCEPLLEELAELEEELNK